LHNALYMDVLTSESIPVSIDTVDLFNESDLDLAYRLIDDLWLVGGDFPISIWSQSPVINPEIGYEGYTWFELEGDLEDALSSGEGDNIRTALRVAEISINSLSVMTTNDLNSFFGFNQYKNRVIRGRQFNKDETLEGTRVCLISEQLADLNNLSVGDKLPMQMYPTALGHVPGNDTAWVPNPYHPGHELTGVIEFTIVGIYMGPAQEISDHAISPNTVFIPGASFAGFDPETTLHTRLESSTAPPILSAIIAPNGELAVVKGYMDDVLEGSGNYYRFYDQGFSKLDRTLSNLRTGMMWALFLTAAGWIATALIFTFFFIWRKKTDVVLLYGVGVSKRRRRQWVFMQCAVVTIIAHAAALAATLPFFGTIQDTATVASWAFTEGYRNYTLSNMNIAGGARVMLLLDPTRLGLTVSTAVLMLALLTISYILSARLARD